MTNLIYIQNANQPELIPYARLNEPQLKHFYEPDEGIFIGESPEVVIRALDAGYTPLSFLIETRYLETRARPILARAGNVPVYAADISALRGITGYHLTRGILGAFRRKPLPKPEKVLEAASRVVILEDVENPTNTGAIFRSAAALGMDAVLLTPGTSDPLYRRAIRVSVGTVFQIPWTYITGEPPAWPEDGIRLLRNNGFRVCAMALTENALSVDDVALHSSEKLAVIMGNEFYGIRPETIRRCDDMVRIPMQHGVDSLNVAAASAVTFWEMGKRKWISDEK